MPNEPLRPEERLFGNIMKDPRQPTRPCADCGHDWHYHFSTDVRAGCIRYECTCAGFREAP